MRNATGLLTAASTTGAVVLAYGYAQAVPGKPMHAAPAKAPTAATRTSPALRGGAAPGAHTPAGAAPVTHAPAPAASSAPALQPPVQAPTTAAGAAQVTSGGS